MREATRDRGEILNFAGSHRMSPGVREGRPQLLPEGETGGRTGWEAFFESMERGRLALAWDPASPESAELVPAAEARPLEKHPNLAEGLERTRRFLQAFRRQAPPAGGAP